MHPHQHEVETNPSMFSPLRLWADEVALNKERNRTLTIALWGCSCPDDSLRVQQRRFLGWVLRKETSMKHKSNSICWQIFTWSINVLADGRWPELDPFGEPWPRNSFRAHMSGQALVPGGHRAIFVHWCSDWDFIVNELGIPWHWDAEQICHLCTASKSSTPCNYHNAAIDAGWTLQRRTNEEFVDAITQPQCALLDLHSFHQLSIYADAAHSDLQGLRQHFVGSTILCLCYMMKVFGRMMVLATGTPD